MRWRRRCAARVRSCCRCRRTGAGLPAVERWYAAHDIKNLPVLLDPMGAAARALGANGIPTTLLVDGKGRERGRLEGGADWADPKSVAMVKALATA